MKRKMTISNRALVFRLYCEKSPELVRDFAADMAERLGLLAEDTRQDVWRDADMSLKMMDPYINDTLIVEMIWNEGDEAQFWAERTEQIRTLVGDLSSKHSQLVLRGMTFVLQACVEPVSALEELHSEAFLEEEGIFYPHPELSQEIAGGHMWLIRIPQGEEKELIYIALGTPETEEDLIQELFDLEFLKKDLIVHKAFQCGRNYRRILASNDLDAFIDELTDSASEILDEPDVLIDEQNTRLDKFAVDYDSLLGVSLALERQKTSLAQQEWNYRLHVGERPTKAIDRLLNLRIISYHQEVTLKCDQCRRLLDGAEKAADIAHTRVERAKEERRQRQEFWLAFLGIALAVPQLLTYETVERLLKYWHVCLCSPLVLLIQVCATLLIAVLFASIVWLVGRNRRKKSA
jgi:hypothetical protein